MALSKKQRELLREMFGGRCAYCGCDLPEKGWHADHIKPVYRINEGVRDASGSFKVVSTGEVSIPERDSFENYYPSCAPCNLFKATYSLEQFRSNLSVQVERAREYSVNFRNAERFGLIKRTNEPVVFWFEKYAKL